jgi:vitamin B12 transporter
MRTLRLCQCGGAVAMIFILARSVLAQEVQDTTQLQELVVTATRLPTPPDAVVSSVTTITAQDLRARDIHFVQDALREVPGASVVQVGSYGGVSSLFLRGGESDYVKVLVDGVPVNQSGGGYNWANLTTDNVDRIEILRGPGSVIYGSDAITGVVQVFTRRGEGNARVRGGVEGGTFGTILGHAGILGGGARFGYSAAASRISTDGTYRFNNDYGNTVVSGSLRSNPGPRSDVTLSARFADNRYHFPTDFSGMLADSNQSNAEKALVVALDAGQRLGERYEVRFTGGASLTDGEFDDRSDSPGDTAGFAFASHRDSRATRANLDARVSAFLTPTLSLTAGSQIERETERQSGETTSNFDGITTTPDIPFDRHRTTLGYYAQGVLDLPSGLALNLNARVDDNSAFGTFFTYRAGAAYRLPRGTRIRASLGRAFKAPTFCEQFCDVPFVVGDSTLRPERSTSWEVGIEQVVAGGLLAVWATYFDQRFRDMILYDGTAPSGEPTYINGAAARAQGVEAGLTTSLGGGMRVSTSYTYLLTKATDDGGMPSPSFAKDDRLIRRPKHSAELAVRGRLFERTTLGGSVTYVGRRDDVDFAQFPSQRVSLPGYAVVDLALEVDIVGSGTDGAGVSGVARVENLFDERYDQVVGFAGHPRGVFGGVKLQL